MTAAECCRCCHTLSYDPGVAETNAQTGRPSLVSRALDADERTQLQDRAIECPPTTPMDGRSDRFGFRLCSEPSDWRPEDTLAEGDPPCG